ncbi:MAG TPA: GNAT family N-acetyltransferase [Ktedonobacteraceae bacterium]|nr:GNAT family N-acetyltransferase [Ktedonobacteraceae bacterium]
MAYLFPRDFLIRPPTMDDVKAVTELVNACNLVEVGEPADSEEDIRNGWRMPGFDLAKDAWVVVAPNGQIVARASLGHKDIIHMYTTPRVHPAYRGLGIEAHLLRLAEERAQHFIPQAPEGARVALNSWVNSHNVDLARVLEEEGFKRIRIHWSMEIEFNQRPPAPEWPDHIGVRTFQPGQERAVFAAFDEAFQDHWGYVPGDFESWKHWTLDRADFDPSLWFIAYEGDEIAGISLCEYSLGTPWVGDLAVRRPWRRKGLGMALLRHSFGEFYRRGSRKARLGVDSQNLSGATRLYERAGMHKAHESYNYEKELRAGVELATHSLSV